MKFNEKLFPIFAMVGVLISILTVSVVFTGCTKGFAGSKEDLACNAEIIKAKAALTEKNFQEAIDRFDRAASYAVDNPKLLTQILKCRWAAQIDRDTYAQGEKLKY